MRSGRSTDVLPTACRRLRPAEPPTCRQRLEVAVNQWQCGPALQVAAAGQEGTWGFPKPQICQVVQANRATLWLHPLRFLQDAAQETVGSRAGPQMFLVSRDWDAPSRHLPLSSLQGDMSESDE